MTTTHGSAHYEPQPDATAVAVPNPPLAPLTPVEIEPLSRLERRRCLAQIVRVNPLDCFDDSGAFDVARARRILPPGAVQSLTVHETTRTNRDGQTTVHRRIVLRLVDKVRAMRLDDALEEKQEKAVESAALKKIAQLEKALAEADDRELQYSKEMEDKDRQIEALQRARHDSAAATAARPPLSPLPPVKSESGSESSPAPSQPQNQSSGAVEEPAERAEAQRRKWEEIQIQSKIREIEHLKNTSGHRAFSLRYPQWPEEAEARRAYALRLIKAEAEAAERQKIASAQRAADLAARPTRPPRRLHPSSFPVQGKPMFYCK